LVVSRDPVDEAPLSSFTSNFRKQWGLAQNYSVTLLSGPVSSGIDAELPWCANTGTDAITTPTARAQTVENLIS
jgi:hypothetical protein